MSNRFLKTASLAAALAFVSPAWSYDASLAESYTKFFSQIEGAGIGKALHLISADAFVKKIKAKEPLLVLDVRTPGETGVFGVTLPDSLAVPVNELFSEANLSRIPTDRTVVVICSAGARAIAAGTALRHIGFDNVYILKGGFRSLAGYLGPAEVN